MTETTSQRPRLAVETDLELAVDGASAHVRSTGDRLFVEFPSLRAATRALRGLPRERTAEVAAFLAAADLTVEVRSRDRTVVAVGADAPAGPLSRWLGTDPAQVRVAGLVAAVGQELAAGVRVVRGLFG